LSPTVIILIAIAYLAILFGVAFYVERRRGDKLLSRWDKWLYALALPVYCTAWTFYGSVGKATVDGWDFLTIYLGPLLAMPLLWLVVRKLIRICQVQRISTLPDFISTRFDNISLSVLTTILIVIGIIPYISIQLKAVSQSFDFMVNTGSLSSESLQGNYIFTDNAFYLSIILAVFIIFFVFRTLETTGKHRGLMAAIAFDAVIKLVAFLAVGVFVTYFLFDGFKDIFEKVDAASLTQFTNSESIDGLEWFLLMLLSMSAFILLPRQFQVMVTENSNEQHLKTAGWVFPLYLLLINLFVVPVALGGKLLLSSNVDPDAYVLALPLLNDANLLAIVTFIGGFSAATAMIIVSTISLSLMLSNNVFLPALFKGGKEKIQSSVVAVRSRKVAVVVIMLLAYFYYRYVAELFPLVSIGLISFAAIIQFMPSVLGALFWKDANKYGVTWGLIAGFAVWFYTLVIPTIVEIGLLPQSLLAEGPLGISWLNPQSLFGMEMPIVAHGTFWSLIFNLIGYFSGSLFMPQSGKERNMAELYVDIYSHSAFSDEKVIWKGELVYKDLLRVSENLLGETKSKEALKHYKKQFGKPVDEHGQVDARFVNYTQRLLSGVVGSVSSKILISSLANEEEIELKEVVQVLKETSETTKLNSQLRLQSLELKRKSQELAKVNERLKGIDKEKDDFISTVTHELRSPLTAIKAFVEILHDHDTTEEERADFLKTINVEIDRMSRLIDQVLDLEKLEAGVITIAKRKLSPLKVIEECVTSMAPLMKTRQVAFHKVYDKSLAQELIKGDEDRLKQAFINLISNAVKYAKEEEAFLRIQALVDNNELEITMVDNGRGIKSENIDRIFDKFFQARDQTRKKPKGTGLGLPITKSIVELHGGSIQVESEWMKGARFTIRLPIYKEKDVLALDKEGENNA